MFVMLKGTWGSSPQYGVIIMKRDIIYDRKNADKITKVF